VGKLYMKGGYNGRGVRVGWGMYDGGINGRGV